MLPRWRPLALLARSLFLPKTPSTLAQPQAIERAVDSRTAAVQNTPRTVPECIGPGGQSRVLAVGAAADEGHDLVAGGHPGR